VEVASSCEPSNKPLCFIILPCKVDTFHVWGKVEVHTGFSWGSLREGDCLEDPGIDGRIILE
jgi:hypothetical protein